MLARSYVHTAAKQGLAAAAPQWDAGPNAKLSTADIVAQLATASEKPGAVARNDGDAAAAIAQAAQTIDAIYQQPFLAHATMEPMNCTVQVTKDGCDIWVGTQIPGRTQAAVMKVTGLKREQIRIHNHLLGGGFGRRLEYDGTVRAVQIAQQVEGPVQVIWTREEDIQQDMYRPYYYDRLSAGVDSHGQVAGWTHRIAGSSIIARYFPAYLKDGIDGDAVEGSANLPYGLSDIHVDWVAQEPPGVPTAFWRGVGVTRGTFAVESFVDELAANAKQDPLAYRLALLDKNLRAKAVLQIAAEKSGWGKPLPAGQGRGIAVCIGFGSFIAQVVQVTVDKEGAVSPTHVWCVDCGIRSIPIRSARRCRAASCSACPPRYMGRSRSRTAGRANQLRRLSVAAHQRSAADRSGSGEEFRGTWRVSANRGSVRDAGSHHCDLRRHRQAYSQTRRGASEHRMTATDTIVQWTRFVAPGLIERHVSGTNW
jgi:isoquinoline 1-oxidoreductase beta subunit